MNIVAVLMTQLYKEALNLRTNTIVIGSVLII